MSRLIAVALILAATCAMVVVISAAATTSMHSVSRWVASLHPPDEGPASNDPTPVSFSIHPGATAADVGEDLRRAGLIRSATAFRVQVELRHVGTRLAVGEYQLRRNMSLDEILDALAAGPSQTRELVTIPEGWRAEEIARYLDSRGVVDATAFVNAVAGQDPAVSIPLPAGATSFEGYLFPETYDFGKDPSAADVLTILLTQFRRTVDPALEQEAAAHGFSRQELITLASIVEREAREPGERAEIAAVFENRLARGMPLQADPTVQYARVPFGLLSVDHFWKGVLDNTDLQADSPYNTYRIKGLPPGPICNPGLASIKAVAEPADEPWLYFVAKGDGSHLFARTLDDHIQNVAKANQGAAGR